MRLGIFGGSFDPVHNGHLALAHVCQQDASLDEIWFMPAAVQPLKRKGPHATNSQRVEMLNLAIEKAPSEPGSLSARPSWRACTLEIDRGGYSYTVDTLREIHIELPEATLFFLVGADAIRDVPEWKEPAEIFRLATPLVVRRAGQTPLDLSKLAAVCDADRQPIEISMPAVDISSTEIRRRVAAGEPIDGLVPPRVADYIAEHRIYH